MYLLLLLPYFSRRTLVVVLQLTFIIKKIQVVVTDYPDPDLVTNLSENIRNCLLLPSPRNIIEKGYIWGRDVAPLLSVIPAKEKFDLLILSDLLFNHSQHKALAETVRLTLAVDGRALVFFTPHRPWLYADDLKFFEVVKELGFNVEKVLEEKLEAPMFEEDPGVSLFF